MNHKKQIEKEDLERLYLVEKKSTSEIGAIYGCSAATVVNRLKEFGISIRTYSEALTGRKNTWAHKAADKNRGKRRPGVGGRQKGCDAWNAGLSKTTHPDVVTWGVAGEDHWAWKGGVSAINTLIRQTPEYKIWRKKVFERDNYTCRCCSQYGGDLEAHHIAHFAVHESLRFDVNNGLTLCVECHKEMHKQEKQNGYQEHETS